MRCQSVGCGYGELNAVSDAIDYAIAVAHTMC